MRGIENFRQLHAKGREGVHIEKAPVVNLLPSDTPRAKPVGLRVNQRVEPVKAFRIRESLQFTDRALNRLTDLRHLAAEPRQSLAGAILFRHDAFQFRRDGSQQFRRTAQERQRCPRRERQREVAVRQAEISILKLHAKLVALQHSPVLIAQHRQQHFVFEFTFSRQPVDVEKVCVG